jgi:hypothetical protein
MPRPVKKTFAEKKAKAASEAEEIVSKARQAKILKEEKFLASCAALDKELAALRISEKLAREKAEADDKFAKMSPEERAAFVYNEYTKELYDNVGRYWHMNTL